MGFSLMRLDKKGISPNLDYSCSFHHTSACEMIQDRCYLHLFVECVHVCDFTLEVMAVVPPETPKLLQRSTCTQLPLYPAYISTLIERQR